jgi:transketolase
LFAGHRKLENLVAICDYNKFQIDGSTDDILSLEPLKDKWCSFGWEVFEMDGHTWGDIYKTLQKAIAVKGKPAMIIAHTIKAKGNKVYENIATSHNIRVPDKEAYEKTIEGLGYTVELPY